MKLLCNIPDQDILDGALNIKLKKYQYFVVINEKQN